MLKEPPGSLEWEEAAEEYEEPVEKPYPMTPELLSFCATVALRYLHREKAKDLLVEFWENTEDLVDATRALEQLLALLKHPTGEFSLSWQAP